MKKNLRSRKMHARSAARNSRPERPAPAPPPAAPSAAPLLEGEALERKVAEKMCEGFRATDARTALRVACGGAEQTAIEAAIVSPRVKGVVEPVTRAFALEHSVAILHSTFCKARAALESPKPTAAEITALKIVVEIFIEKMMERIEGGLWQESFSLLGFSDYEKTLIENLMLLVRGQRTPVSEAPQHASDSAESGETGE